MGSKIRTQSVYKYRNPIFVRMFSQLTSVMNRNSVRTRRHQCSKSYRLENWWSFEMATSQHALRSLQFSSFSLIRSSAPSNLHITNDWTGDLVLRLLHAHLSTFKLLVHFLMTRASTLYFHHVQATITPCNATNAATVRHYRRSDAEMYLEIKNLKF